MQRLKATYRTKYGTMYVGKSEDVLCNGYPISRNKGKVQLIFTSPPFPLNEKKKYGNLQGDEYLKWIASFAPIFKEYLTENGSIVIEVGNAWEPNQPTMSTLAMEALLEFKKQGNFHLCQEFICYNPARLPSPAQWVTVKRIRVKDSFTRVWWLSPVAYPKADNRKVLSSYSESMLKLLKRGTYNAGKRPSEHNIGKESFLKNHGGAIPPNVLIPSASDFAEALYEYFNLLTNMLCISNTKSDDPYQKYCRNRKIELHPARMPFKLVDFFINFLTDKKDIVLDPFAGSNTTGFIAEDLQRKWISIEANKEYAESSKSRFEVNQ